jgi:hypothetical protein
MARADRDFVKRRPLMALARAGCWRAPDFGSALEVASGHRTSPITAELHPGPHSWQGLVAVATASKAEGQSVDPATGVEGKE